MLRASLLSTFLLIVASITAQTYVMGGDDINRCSGTFYDSGQFNPYNPLDSLETVICPTGSDENRTRLTFVQIDLAKGDSLRFFDGTDNSAPELFSLTDLASGHPFTIQASASNVSGCLTVRFVTNDDGNAAEGWEAGISCVPTCQRIVNEVQYGTSPSAEGTVEFCLDEEVSLSTSVSFPDNNEAYEQSLDSMDFYWLYGADTVGIGPSVNWLPTEEGFGQLQLISVDQRGCTNVDYNRVWAFIGPPPSVEQTGPEELIVCPGETVVLYTSASDTDRPGFQIGQASAGGAFPINSDDFLYIDGPEEISSTVLLEDYPANATLGTDILLDSIQFLLEHSYAGDLQIDIICPNGQLVTLIDYPAGLGSSNFGEPFAQSPVDEQTKDRTPGIPYTYSFSPQADFSFYDFDPDAPFYVYTTVPSAQNGASYTYADTHYPSGSYLPEESLDGLNGCPLNGEWEFKITDNLGLDNGHLFGWSLHFSGTTPIEGDPLNTTVWSWEDSDAIVSQNRDSVIVVPTGSGTEILTLTVDDLFGCTISTEYQITVLPWNNSICQGFAPTVPELSLDPILWPNPFSGEINVSLPTLSEDNYWRIFSANGQLMSEGATGQSSINTANWPTGLYLFQMVDRTTGSMIVERMVKQ